MTTPTCDDKGCVYVVTMDLSSTTGHRRTSHFEVRDTSYQI